MQNRILQRVPDQKVQVWFIGAGPGDPELITVKGQRLIREAALVLYAGSLVPRELVREAKAGSRVIDSSPLTLEETHSLMLEAVRQGGLVARVHTGDPSLYGAVQEQKALLDAAGITSGVVPGVSAAFAAAAAAGAALTVPGLVQTVSITRLGGRTGVPERQRISRAVQLGGALAIYLSAGDMRGLVEELRSGGLADDAWIVAACRVGWPDERLITAQLGELERVVEEYGFTRQTVFLVLPALQQQESTASRLYAKDFSHGFREI